MPVREKFSRLSPLRFMKHVKKGKEHFKEATSTSVDVGASTLAPELSLSILPPVEVTEVPISCKSLIEPQDGNPAPTKVVRKSDLEECADNDCSYCTLLIHCIDGCTPGVAWETCVISHDDSEVLRAHGDIRVYFHIQLVASLRDENIRLFHIPFAVAEHARKMHWLDFDSSTVYFEGTNSNGAFSRAISWLDNCVENHPGCKNPTSGKLPHRIIDLGPDGVTLQDVRLVETLPKTYQTYACLSHCWGKSAPCITTTKNIMDRKLCIPYHELPKTFQDAVSFCRKLDIRWLWIDSLCILQDDDSDWKHEAAAMADIYSNAYVTLAATKCADSSEGFYIERRMFTSVCQLCDRDSFYMVGARLRNVYPHVTDHWRTDYPYGLDLVKFPLLGRGWAFQERMLSPRVIHFGPDELSFECMLSFRCECGIGSSLVPKSRLYAENWVEICKSYAQCRLSFAKDTLPALAGLARQYKGVMAGEYLAGIWEDDLAQGLSWWSETAENRKAIETDPRIPSWSWASNMHSASTNFEYFEVTTSQIRLCGKSYVLAGPDEYGEVEQYAHIDLEGDVVPGSLSWNTQPSVTAHVTSRKTAVRDIEKLRIDARAQFWKVRDLEVLFFCLGLHQHRKGKQSEIFLILVSDSTVQTEVPTYRRIGICSVNTMSHRVEGSDTYAGANADRSSNERSVKKLLEDKLSSGRRTRKQIRLM